MPCRRSSSPAASQGGGYGGYGGGGFTPSYPGGFEEQTGAHPLAGTKSGAQPPAARRRPPLRTFALL